MGSEDISRYVVKHPASGIYRYYRRVPTEIAHLDKRTHVKQSLKTKSLKEALEKAQAVHDAAESFWRALLAGNDNEAAFARYEWAVKLAQSMGFTYRPIAEVAALPLDELERRLTVIGENMDRSQIIVDSLAGTVEEPAPRLSNIWSLYEKHNAAGLTGMSKNQLRKHKVSRERAIRSLRHSFQDRIENAGCSDRMQADLMGHEFGRPKYGDGAEMKRRQEFLEGIAFAWPQLAAA
ncbi:DUF6538 domain-containing protein [Sinorhizobium meliloti]|uniref:DUF6538 domain-containing protein n=1 Tax=Rhizobium meliloti TaxID=382 RepID=UPI000FD35018|nr:DUF6538 domain-containing protein [Sinorhizobium meliloti]RVN78018.1 hypothetical protein CN101_38215 [Sinorhizobium meliloti]RVO52189.1 hypothetical protein CN094_29870 [Sinorhizobium meliloti]